MIDLDSFTITPPQTLEDLIIKELRRGVNIFLTGPGGVGKSVLTRSIINKFNKAIVLGSTGMAAYNIGGETVHRVFGFGISNSIEELIAYDEAQIDKMVNKGIPKNKAEFYILNKLNELIWDNELIVIDEVSMLSANILDMIYFRMQQVGKTRPILFVGDFYQLPPVTKGLDKPVYMFESELWQPKTVELTTVKRTDEIEFAKILNRIRVGEHTSSDLNFIKSLDRGLIKGSVKLFSKNKQVDETNISELLKIDKKLLRAKTRHTVVVNENIPEFMINKFREELNLPEVLELKVGARVMFNVNHIDRDFFNGELGTIVGATKSNETGEPLLIIQKDNGQEVLVGKYSYEKKTLTRDNGRAKIKTSVIFEQFPVVLAFAMTIHKSQGKTIPNLYIDCKGMFATHQFYVALSRASNTEHLSLVNFKPTYIKVDNKVHNFYNKQLDLLDIPEHLKGML